MLLEDFFRMLYDEEKQHVEPSLDPSSDARENELVEISPLCA